MKNLIDYVIGIFLILFFQSCNFQRTYTWSNGDKYVGQWLNGKENGQGTKTSPNGSKQVGKWLNGKLISQGNS